MDKVSIKRVVLFWGLLFCVVMGGAASVFAWEETVRTRDEEMLGQLILLEPKTEQEYVSVMRGKQAADPRASVRAGREADERYGYVGDYAFISPTVAAFLPVQVASTVLVALLLGDLILFQKKRQGKMEVEMFALQDELAQALEENRVLRGEMEQEEKKTKTLVTDVSHQLKTPLASLKMCYEIAIKRTQVSLQKILQDAVNSVYMKAYEKGIDVSVVGSEAGDVYLDPHWTQEALVNILDNGVKYSAQGTAIEIRIQRMVSHYLLEIEDEGMGIQREERNRIFQRFYRGRSKAVQETEGSGVGLYLTRKILEAQGGTICVRPGKRGSLFQVTVPCKV